MHPIISVFHKKSIDKSRKAFLLFLYVSTLTTLIMLFSLSENNEVIIVIGALIISFILGYSYSFALKWLFNVNKNFNSIYAKCIFIFVVYVLFLIILIIVSNISTVENYIILKSIIIAMLFDFGVLDVAVVLLSKVQPEMYQLFGKRGYIN